MISIAALVLTLAALNMSFGIRRIYVKILSFVFDYATRIKKDKEISIDSDLISTEPPTPPQIESLTIEKSFDDSIELSPDISSSNESKIDDELNNSQNDMKFKLSKNLKYLNSKVKDFIR
jgi:hypothetical protein